MAAAEREQGRGQLKGGVCCSKIAACETTWEKKGERLLMKLMSKLEAPLQSMLISPYCSLGRFFSY